MWWDTYAAWTFCEYLKSCGMKRAKFRATHKAPICVFAIFSNTPPAPVPPAPPLVRISVESHAIQVALLIYQIDIRTWSFASPSHTLCDLLRTRLVLLHFTASQGRHRSRGHTEASTDGQQEQHKGYPWLPWFRCARGLPKNRPHPD